MGYPVEMIGKDTVLFSLIGTDAIESQEEAIFNRYFQERDVDAKVMPLNIRMDDIGFFLYNFKNSKVKGAYFQREFWSVVHNLLDELSDEAKACGIVDSLDVVDGENVAYVTLGEAVVELVKPQKKRVAIVGNTPALKSVVYRLNQADVEEIILYDTIIERTMELSRLAPDVKIDVERIEGESVRIDADICIVDDVEMGIETEGKVVDLSLEKGEQDRLGFDMILDKIAEIKTREWVK